MSHHEIVFCINICGIHILHQHIFTNFASIYIYIFCINICNHVSICVQCKKIWQVNFFLFQADIINMILIISSITTRKDKLVLNYKWLQERAGEGSCIGSVFVFSPVFVFVFVSLLLRHPMYLKYTLPNTKYSWFTHFSAYNLQAVKKIVPKKLSFTYSRIAAQIIYSYSDTINRSWRVWISSRKLCSSERESPTLQGQK